MSTIQQHCVLMNIFTGEVLQDYPDGIDLPDSDWDLERRRQAAFYKDKDDLGYDPRFRNFDGSVEHGSFTWFRCETGSPLNLSLGNADLVRLFLLSTYATYKGKLVSDGERPLNIKDCATIFKTSYGVAATVLSRIEDAKMLRREDGAYWINPKFFRRGQLPARWSRRIDQVPATTVRIYHESFRWVYANCERSHVGRLSYVLKLIPYLNFGMNYVCQYPWCPDVVQADPQTSTKAAKLIGMTSPHFDRFRSAIDETSLVLSDGSPVIAQVPLDEMPKDKRYLVVNPHFIYGGMSFDLVSDLGKFYSTSPVGPGGEDAQPAESVGPDAAQG